MVARDDGEESSIWPYADSNQTLRLEGNSDERERKCQDSRRPGPGRSTRSRLLSLELSPGMSAETAERIASGLEPEQPRRSLHPGLLFTSWNAELCYKSVIYQRYNPGPCLC